MAKIRLYSDEDAGELAVIEASRTRGVDILTTAEADRQRTTDTDQLAYATREGRSIYTFNTRHFAGIHKEYLAEGKTHAGIITVPRQRYSVGEKIRRLAALVSRISAEEMVNRMEYL